MNLSESIIGTWISIPNEAGDGSNAPKCIWHVLDDRTCVYEQQTDMGLMVSWFQYWRIKNGILRYPLGKTTRSMFKGKAEHVAIDVHGNQLKMNGCTLIQTGALPIPERHDIYPGTQLDENGATIPTAFRGMLLDHLSEAPYCSNS